MSWIQPGQVSRNAPGANTLSFHESLRQNMLLPFVVLAVQEPIEDLSQGADMVQVVQDDHKRHLHSIVFTIALVGKVGEVLAEFL